MEEHNPRSLFKVALGDELMGTDPEPGARADCSPPTPRDPVDSLDKPGGVTAVEDRLGLDVAIPPLFGSPWTSEHGLNTARLHSFRADDREEEQANATSQHGRFLIAGCHVSTRTSCAACPSRSGPRAAGVRASLRQFRTRV